MNEAVDKPMRKRVLVALESAAESARALETAFNLASKFGSELTALFVENVNLLRGAALPFTREIGGATAAPLPFEAAVLERAFRAEAARIEQLLTRSASERKVQWTLQVRRGQPLNEAVNSAQQADVLVLAALQGLTSSITGRGNIVEHKPNISSNSILVMLDRSAAVWRTLMTGLALANGQHELVLLLASERGAEFDALKQQAEAWLAQHGAAARFISLSPAASGLSGMARRHPSLAIVAPLQHVEHNDAALRTLYRQARCPLVLIR